MGYDLHITRLKHWSDQGNDIAADEWLAYIKRDPELTLSPENGLFFARWSGKSKCPDPWLDWFRGNIYTKNPDKAIIDKMVAIAGAIGAKVQGDEGEIYSSGHAPPVFPKPSIIERLGTWFVALRRTRIEAITPPFNVGDRVLDVFRKEAIVVELDAKANHCLGRVKVKYDDGREASFMLAACGLAPKPK